MKTSFAWSAVALVFSLGLGIMNPAAARDGQKESMAAYLTSKMPERPTSPIPGGKALLLDYREAPIPKREEAILEALQRGYFPDSMRALKPITIKEKGHTLTFWVTPDYVSIGNNDEAVLVPLSFISARKLLTSWGFLLPTPKMVDAIFHQAEIVLWPRIYPPAPEMVSVSWLEAHNDLIRSQRFLELDLSRLAAGHKKDIVLSPRLKQHGRKIAIYGWQNIRAGENIQPLSTWHGERYVDYSHGLRLVGAMGLLDGKLVALRDILRDPELSELVSREGPISVDDILGEPMVTASQP